MSDKVLLPELPEPFKAFDQDGDGCLAFNDEQMRSYARQAIAMNTQVPDRQQCIDLWMKTDQDHRTLFDHLHRYTRELLAAAPSPTSEDSHE